MNAPVPPAPGNEFFSCFACRTVTPLLGSTERKCSCGSTRGEVLSAQRFKEAFDAGAIFNRGRDGKPLKR